VARWHALRFAPIQPIAHSQLRRNEVRATRLEKFGTHFWPADIGNDHFSCSSLPCRSPHTTVVSMPHREPPVDSEARLSYLHVSTLPASAANPSRRASVRLRGLFGKWLDLSPIIIVLDGRVRGPGPDPRIGVLETSAPAPLLEQSSRLSRPRRPPRRPLDDLLRVRAGIQRGCRPDHVLDLSLFVAFSNRSSSRRDCGQTDIVLALIALAGIVILVPAFDIDDRITQGACWGVASGLTFAVLSLLNRRFVRHHSSITRALPGRFSPRSYCCLSRQLTGLSSPCTNVLLLLVLGVLCTAIAHSLFIDGLKGNQHPDRQHDRLSGAGLRTHPGLPSPG